MRKWLIALVAVLLLLLLGAYLLIPSQQAISQYTFVGAGQNSVYRCLSDESCIQRWWRDSSERNTPQTAPATLQKDGYNFQFVPRFGNVVTADISNGHTTFQSSLAVLSLQPDSSAVEWKVVLPEATNVFERIRQYFFAKKLRNNMAGLLHRFQVFMNNDKLVYGMEVQPAKVTDTMVITTSIITPHYPTTTDYYNLIQKLKAYIAAQGAQETNYPMLNISEVQKHYQARVAIPVNKVLPSSGDIAFKRLIPGNILIAEVSGGPHTVDKSLQQLENFVSEKGFRSPAIPFQSLVTDRLQEEDTTKWITRLYYPVY